MHVEGHLLWGYPNHALICCVTPTAARVCTAVDCTILYTAMIDNNTTHTSEHNRLLRRLTTTPMEEGEAPGNYEEETNREASTEEEETDSGITYHEGEVDGVDEETII